MVVDVPPGPVYGALFDLWQVPIGAINPPKGGAFVVAPEDFKGSIPAAATLLKSRTKLAAVLGRGLVVNDDVEAAVHIVEAIKVYPLAKIASPPQTKMVHVTGLHIDTTSPEGMPFWERTAQAINLIPDDDDGSLIPDDGDGSLLLALLKPLGIEQGKPFEPDPRQKKILEDAAQLGWLMNQAIGMPRASRTLTIMTASCRPQ